MLRKLKIMLILAGFIAILFGLNWIVQAYRNPAILLDLIAADYFKSADATWEVYGDLFEEHSTALITADYLAALTQVESAGNPLVIPEWRWRLTTDITRIFAPASTSAGLYQYTRGTFEDAKRFCIHNHQVALKGHILNPKSCWFNSLYSRFWPSHAIEMTSARLDYYVTRILQDHQLENTSLLNKHKLASIIHLCGVSKANLFARHDFKFDRLPRCGSHSTQGYFSQIQRAISRRERPSRHFWLRLF